MNSLRKFWTERSDDLKYVCGSQAIEMRTKQWKTFSIYLVVNIEMPVIWHGEKIGRRKKKKRARGGRWQEEREEASPLAPSHRFFDNSSHRHEPLWRRELRPIVQYHLRYTQLHFAALFQFKAPRLNTKIF